MVFLGGTSVRSSAAAFFDETPEPEGSRRARGDRVWNEHHSIRRGAVRASGLCLRARFLFRGGGTRRAGEHVSAKERFTSGGPAWARRDGGVSGGWLWL